MMRTGATCGQKGSFASHLGERPWWFFVIPAISFECPHQLPGPLWNSSGGFMKKSAGVNSCVYLPPSEESRWKYLIEENKNAESS